MQKNKISVNNFSIFLVLIIFAGIFLRIKFLLSSPSMWVDECTFVTTIRDKNYIDFFAPLINIPHPLIAPPFVLIIQKFIYSCASSITDNLKSLDIAIRIFPTFCGCLCLPVFAYSIQKIFKSEYFTLMATTILAFNKFAVYYSNECRQYVVELLISIIFLFIFFKLKNLQKTSTLFFVIPFCIFSVWFSSTAIVYLSVFSVLFLIKYIKEKNHKILFTYLSLILINFGIYCYKYLFSNLISEQNKFFFSFWESSQAFLNLDNFINNFANFNLYLFLSPEILNLFYSFNSFGNLFFYLFILLILIFFLKYTLNNKLYNILVFTVIPPVLFIILSFLKFYPYHDRMIICLIPEFIILICSPLLFLNKKIINTIILQIVILLIIFINITKNTDNFIFYKSPIRELSNVLKKHNPTMNNIISYPDELFCYNRNATLSYDLVAFYKNKKNNTLNLKGDYYIFYSLLRRFEFENYGADLNFLKSNFEILEYIPSMIDPTFYYAKIRIK